MKISLGFTILSALAASACALQGTIVTDSGPLRVRAEPNINSAVVGQVEHGAQIEIDCYKRGQWITGLYSSDIWDHIPNGYVSDAWVNTDGKLAPLCGGGGGSPPPSGFTGTVRIDGGVLHIRSGPSTSNPIVGTLPNGATVPIECMAHSQYIENGRHSSDIWDKIPQGWVSDAMIDTGGKLTRLCDGGPTTPPPTGGTIPGLTARQSGYARTIAAVARQRNLGKDACNVAIATALVESSLTVYCNRNVPGSCNLPHDAEAHDHLSVGIFQQQSPMWGTPRDCMDPATSAGLFYSALGRVPNWRGMPIGVAAQKVQRSAFPNRYAGRANQASIICNAAY